MNLNKILKAIQQDEPEGFEKVDSRRGILKSFGAKVAVAALPIAVASATKKANAQIAGEMIEGMNLILTYEYLGHHFYKSMLENGPVFTPANGRNAFEIMVLQKSRHIEFLKYTITNAGGVPVESPIFDLTGGEGSGSGPFADSMTDYRKMLALAQTIQDTTARAQKGLVTKLMVNDVFLAAVLRMHTVAAKHAAHIRLMRWEAGVAIVRPWVTGTRSDTDNSYLQSYYAGEAPVTQLGINLVGLNGETLDYDTVTEAFDEPISKEQAQQLLVPFIDL